jgi:hypothetical protein
MPLFRAREHGVCTYVTASVHELDRGLADARTFSRQTHRTGAMAYRNFVDEQGTHWEVWEILPQMVERRLGAERRLQNAAETGDWGDDPPVIDRRVLRDRRTLGRTRPAPRVNLGSAMNRGWLAFESEEERRRLCPIPAGWDQVDDRDLAALCRQAVSRPKRALA